MVKGFILAEAIYDYCAPEQFREWPGCNHEPKYLSKHMATTDVSILTSLITGKMPTLRQINAIEETTFITIGYPKCWEKHKKLYFIKNSKEIDLPD